MQSKNVLWCAAAILAAAGQANAADKSWNIGSGNWNTGANWLAPGVPGAADNVFLGNTVPALNSWVNLNVNSTVASMNITDGMVFDTENSRMVVTGATTVSGRNFDGFAAWPSRIVVQDSIFNLDYVTENCSVSDEAWVEMRGGTLEVQGLLAINATAVVTGDGVVKLTSNAATALRNNGHIGAGVNGLTISQQGTGRIDLDGSVLDDSAVTASVYMGDGSAFANLTINGDQLTDTYDEALHICSGGFININMSNGWAMSSVSSVRFSSGLPDQIARLNGTDLSFAGSIELSGTGCHAEINTPLTLEPAADVLVGPQDVLDITGPITVNGGLYSVALGGVIAFNGDTTVHGGTFTSDPETLADAPVAFNGETTWDGIVTMNGRASQEANATVSGPTVITADAFDMDGNLGTSNWGIGDHLTVNAANIEETQNGNGFHGIMTISGGFASRLSVNLSTPGAIWNTSNVLNLSGVFNIPTTRIDGSPLQIHGALNVTGSVQIDADTTIGNDTAVTFSTPTSELRLSGRSSTYNTATYAGQGSLHNLASGDLLIYLHSDLGQTSLINDGSMKVSNLLSDASVNRFTQTATGSWNVQIGGNDPGVLNDVLRVTGAPSTINGIVNVELVEVNNVQFLPTIGQTFLFLDARHGVTGTFTNSPVSITGNGTIVEWSYVYTPNQVFLRADSITLRCPADFNQDGIVDFFDYLDFVDAFSAESMTSDFNHDGVIDFFDYLDFVDAFSAGC